MTDKGSAGERVATAIAVVKWVLIMFAALSAILGSVNVALRADTTISYSVTVALVIVSIAAAWSLFVWVLFGWFEHTLLALVTIARNTSPMPTGVTWDAPHERTA